MDQTEILLIEDSDDDADLATRALRRAKVTNKIVRIRDAETALAYLASANLEGSFPGIMILDLGLPGMKGLDFLKRLYSTFQIEPEQTLVVVLSGLDNLRTLRDSYTLGVDAFLAKPLEQHDIVELLASFPKFWNIDPRPGLM